MCVAFVYELAVSSPNKHLKITIIIIITTTLAMLVRHFAIDFLGQELCDEILDAWKCLTILVCLGLHGSIVLILMKENVMSLYQNSYGKQRSPKSI